MAPSERSRPKISRRRPGQLETKYLNALFAVDRGAYANLPTLTIAAVAIGFRVPIGGILAFGKRAT